MTQTRLLKKWLTETPLRGPWAALCVVAAIALPTLMRVSMGMDSMWLNCCLPYYPFILVATVLLGWRLASFIAIVSAAISAYLFVGTPYALFEGLGDLFVASAFLLSAFFVIGLVHLIRRVAVEVLRLTEYGEPTSGIVFSLEAGQAWASWYGASTPLRLGPQEEVAEMMQDFLAQLELGKRLARNSRPDASAGIGESVG